MEIVGNVQLVAGNVETLESIFELLKREGIEPQGNPDVYVREYPAFGVDEARELGARANTRALNSTRRVFIIVAPGMTTEAQNALLKTLEEPPADALFFFVVPSPEMLLPTVRSRSQILLLGNEKNGQGIDAIDAGEFLKSSPAVRLELIKPLYEKEDNEQRDIAPALAFLAALEQFCAEDVVKNRTCLEAVYHARKFISDKGSLVKALLEQVALLA